MVTSWRFDPSHPHLQFSQSIWLAALITTIQNARDHRFLFEAAVLASPSGSQTRFHPCVRVLLWFVSVPTQAVFTTNNYRQTNLVSDVPGMAILQDDLLINP
jgi:hypothetical protein